MNEKFDCDQEIKSKYYYIEEAFRKSSESISAQEYRSKSEGFKI